MTMLAQNKETSMTGACMQALRTLRTFVFVDVQTDIGGEPSLPLVVVVVSLN